MQKGRVILTMECDFMICITILILGLCFIFKDEIKTFLMPKKEIEITEEEKERVKKMKEQFNDMMNYSIDKAIESKRGDRQWKRKIIGNDMKKVSNIIKPMQMKLLLLLQNTFMNISRKIAKLLLLSFKIKRLLNH